MVLITTIGNNGNYKVLIWRNECIKQGNQYVESTEKYNIVYNGFQFGNEDEFPNLKGFFHMENGRIVHIIYKCRKSYIVSYAVCVTIFLHKGVLLTPYKRSPQKDKGLRLYSVCLNFLTLCVYTIKSHYPNF